MIPCDRCDGRGWMLPPTLDAFAERCGRCGGAGRVGFAALARTLAPKDGDARERLRYAIERVYRGGRVRGVTARRLLHALARRGLLA